MTWYLQYLDTEDWKTILFGYTFALDMNECNRISQCKMAKEVWRILEMTYEGTRKVKDSKVRMHVN